MLYLQYVNITYYVILTYPFLLCSLPSRISLNTDLVLTKEAAHPTVTSMDNRGSKCQTAVHVSQMGVGQVRLLITPPAPCIAPPAWY